MKTKAIMLGALLLGLSAVQSRAGTDEFAPRGDGFIRDWLLLAPIQLAADADGAEAIEKNQIPDEGQLKPKAVDKVTVRGKELTWKKVKATDYFLDLNAICNAETEKTAMRTAGCQPRRFVLRTSGRKRRELAADAIAG